MNTKKLTTFITTIGVIFFIASLTQKCYCVGYECKDSINVFLLGWLGILIEIYEVVIFILLKIVGDDTIFNNQIGASSCWLANPLIISSFVTVWLSPKTTIVLSLFASLLILSFLLYRNVIVDVVPYTGSYQGISSYKAGYYLWLASSLAMLTGSIYLTTKPKLTTNRKNDL